MKKIIILFLLVSTAGFGQEDRLKNVDRIVSSYGKFDSLELLAKQIDYDFHSDIEKVRAIYAWTSTNIAYSYRNPFRVGNAHVYIVTDEDDYQRRLKRADQQLLEKTFENQKGTCKGYALIVQEICELLNIESEVVLGYVKSSPDLISYIPNQKNHAWNAVKVDDQWIFLDTTFASGHLVKNVWQPRYSDSFFNIDKDVISDTYFAEDVKWRKQTNPISLEEFSKLPKFSEAYFDREFELLQPKIGEITTRKRASIYLRVKGIDFSTRVQYQYDEGPAKLGKVSFDQSVAKIHIRSPKKNSILKVYFDGKEAINYQVVLGE